MPTYDCPECGAKLKTGQAVAAGKKLRCPKCETVFPVGGKSAPAREKPAVAATPAAPKERAEDLEGGLYRFQDEAPDEAGEEQRKQAFDPIKDRFEKSKRGPAQALVVKPSDWLLRSGIGVCISAIVGFLFAGWPMVFKVEEVSRDPKAKYAAQDSEKRKFKELTSDEYKERFVYMGVFVFEFFWGAVIALGASKMHTLESYALAMTASVMTLVNPFTGLGAWLVYDYMHDKEPWGYELLGGVICLLIGAPLSAICIATLRYQKVIDGFAEEKPEDYTQV